MFIEAITTSCGYGDFLAETLKQNLPQVDRMTVVTSVRDAQVADSLGIPRTLDVCREHSVRCLVTELFWKDGEGKPGAAFSKARGIDFGMSFCAGTDWFLHLDADTALPPMARKWLEWIDLDPDVLYGFDRVNVVGHAAWDAHLAERHLQHDYNCRVKIPAFPMGYRIAMREYGGWLPIGYAQLAHFRHNRRYPLHHGDAERTDVQFSLQWEAKNRRLIPEIVAFHLMSEASPLGTNWKGRKSAPFRDYGPATDPKTYTTS